MKIAIVGCGALGSYYGALLTRAGHETYFLLRSDYETVNREGVVVRHGEGEFRVHPRAARDPEDIGPADLVVIGLKTTANHCFEELLPPLVDEDTRILTLQNGLGNEEALARLFTPEQILGGLCFVCLNRIAPGVIQHIAHGRIVMGEFQRPANPKTHRLAADFQAAGIPCEVTDNLEEAHWQKLVWNVPFNGLGVASAAGRAAVESGKINANAPKEPNLTTDKLLADPAWAKLVRELMIEIIDISIARGMGLTHAEADVQIARTLEMGAYRASTLVDYEAGRELELDALFLEPQRLARVAGVPTPRLDALCKVLGALAP